MRRTDYGAETQIPSIWHTARMRRNFDMIAQSFLNGYSHTGANPASVRCGYHCITAFSIMCTFFGSHKFIRGLVT
jgi:hypothetical protein